MTKNVWKVGSNWGNESILDLFLDYGCIFIGGVNDGKRKGNWQALLPGDLLIISDKSTPVAIGEALSPMETYENSDIRMSKHDEDTYIDDDVRLCKAHIALLSQEERKEYWGIDTRRRFCRHMSSEKVVATWDKYLERRQQEEFDISSRTMSLFDRGAEEGIFSPNIKYRIPIYQRPYSWGENELRRLIEDLRQAVPNDEPVFMGTMQLTQAIPLSANGVKKAHDIIDGQQRITTFILLLCLIQHKMSKNPGQIYMHALRTLVNRGEAQRDLDEFWMAYKQGTHTKQANEVLSRNPYLRNAAILEGLLEEYFPTDSTDEEEVVSIEELWDFLQGKIRFVVIETRAGLSKTLKIFDTINTAGLDLGAEDLFKIRFYEYRKWCGDQDQIFDQISDVYASIEVFNREHPGYSLSMGALLATCQRVLIAKYDMSYATFEMGYERFFDRFFDTVLGMRIWPEFKTYVGKKDLLNVEDLNNLLNCFVVRQKLRENDWNYRIMERMLWETRYGYVHDYGVIALFFKQINEDELYNFTTALFKVLVPPSLFWAKKVYAVRRELFQLLKEISKKPGIAAVNEVLISLNLGGLDLVKLMEHACTYEIVWNPLWKRLICRLAEYLKNDKKDEALYKKLFECPIDIEHIQSYTDENNPEQVREHWGGELNRLGNLTILEQSLNRSINNKSKKKKDAYAQSRFVSVRELKDKVSSWTKELAEERRANITDLLCSFLFTVETQS